MTLKEKAYKLLRERYNNSLRDATDFEITEFIGHEKASTLELLSEIFKDMDFK